ncbi:pentatricopeptide repeat-containing protein At4g18840-like [Wolffia australiana]
MVPSCYRAQHPRCMALLQAAGAMADLLQIQAQMLRNDLFFSDDFAAGKLLELCVRSSANLHHGRKIFNLMKNPDIFAWNTLLRGHAASPSPSHALHLFSLMAAAGPSPNSYTFTFLLKACAGLKRSQEGEQVHSTMAKLGADRLLFPSNALISMYASCHKIHLARLVFDTASAKDIVSWNALLSGFLRCGLVLDARKLFDEMPERGIVSWNAMINGYADAGELQAARELFDGMPERDSESWNTMISGYARGRRLGEARELFRRMPERNAVSWSTMISAYAQGGEPVAALELFEEMRQRRLRPNWAAVVSLLSACASRSNLQQGKLIHRYIDKNKMKLDCILGTALIDMYAKCGCVGGAAEVFEGLKTTDVFAWTAMIGGLAANGQGKRALELFQEMLERKIRPNAVTFVGVLSACSHLGDANLARSYFESMKLVHGIEPELEHYGCLVDALGRAGRTAEAAEVAEAAPGSASTAAEVWGTLLGACWVRGDVQGGEYAASRLAGVGAGDGGEYVVMANLCAASGRWDEARRLRQLMKDGGISKCLGWSSVEIPENSQTPDMNDQ